MDLMGGPDMAPRTPLRSEAVRGTRAAARVPESFAAPELFDTHAHLHFPDFAGDLADVLARARGAGVRGVLTVGTDVETSRAALALAEREADVWATVGVHPHDASAATDAALAELAQLVHHPRALAVGEIGLDYFRNLSPREDQHRTFTRLLRLARDAGKPVVIHCREAYDDVLRLLADERVADLGGIMHCFSGTADIARRALDLGLVISMAGPVTYPNARALPEVARLVPDDRLVVETDCPYLPPQRWRGKRNEPAYVVATAARVAELRGEPLETLAARTSATARRVLGLARGVGPRDGGRPDAGETGTSG
jgi:TatD DNase family protein